MFGITSKVAALVATSLLLLGSTTASSHHHHFKNHEKKQTICKDRPGVHCQLIAMDDDCDKFTTRGESYGDTVCQVSCGRCEAVPDEIFTDQLCYPFAKQVIEVRFSNSNPNNEDWVGIYPATADSKDLGSPVAWFWLCGDKKHRCRTSVGSVTFPWLPPGNYKAIMSRNKDAPGPYANYGPYASYAESQPFEVSRGEMCAARRLEAAEEISSSLRGSQQQQ